MIQVHLMELFATNEIYGSTFGMFSLFFGAVPAAPVFMVVMGYFAFRTNKTGKALLRGAKIFLLGLVLNIGLNAHLLLKIYQGDIAMNPYQYIFGADILFLAGLSIIVIAILKKLFHGNLIMWLLAALILASANAWLPNYTGQNNWIYYVQALFWGQLSWSFFPVFPWMVYPVLGVLFQLIEKKYNQQLNNVLSSNLTLPALFILNIPIFMKGFTIATELQAYYHHPAWFVVWAILFTTFWMMLLYRLCKITSELRVNTYLVWVGKNVTVFYVIQWLIIGNIATAIFRTQSWPMLFAWFIVILFVTSALTKMWLKLKKSILVKSVD
jgi:hypothetical protein